MGSAGVGQGVAVTVTVDGRCGCRVETVGVGSGGSGGSGWCGRVQVQVGRVVVALADPDAALRVWSAWCELAALARRAFDPETPAAGMAAGRVAGTVAGTDVRAYVTLAGRLPAVVEALAGPVSRSGCGESRVRVGGLTIVCRDWASYAEQLASWAVGYEMATRLWPALPGVQTVADRAVAVAARRSARLRLGVPAGG